LVHKHGGGKDGKEDSENGGNNKGDDAINGVFRAGVRVAVTKYSSATANKGRDDATQPNVQHELQEILHVVGAYTIIYPGAVVIHLVNAAAANGAMVSTRRLNAHAFLAHTAFWKPYVCRVNVLNVRRVLGHRSRVCCCSTNVRRANKCDEALVRRNGKPSRKAITHPRH
jgi:hypothetical protein